MPREKPGYRDNLELLNEFFPQKNMLSKSDIISKADFARKISQSGVA